MNASDRSSRSDARNGSGAFGAVQASDAGLCPPGAHDEPPSAPLTAAEVTLLRRELGKLAEAYRSHPTTYEQERWSNDRVAAGVDLASAVLDGVLAGAADRHARDDRAQGR